MSSKQWWNIGKNVFKILITVGAIYLLSTKIEFSELKSGLLSCNPWYLLLAFFCYVISQIIASSRLNSFFNTNGIQLTERYNLRLYQLGLLYNYFIPGGIGGDAYKIFLLKQRFGYSGRKILSSVFFDRLSGLWALCVYVGVLVCFMPRFAIPNVLTISAVIIGTGTYFFLLKQFFPVFTKNFLTTHIKALLVQGFQALTAVVILYSIGFNDKFSPNILVFLVSSLVAIVPSLFGAVGVRETVVAFLSEYLGIDKHIPVLMTMFFNFISILLATSGVYYIIRPQGLGADKLPSAREVEEEIERETNQET